MRTKMTVGTCNHDIRLEGHTMKISNIKMMVYPEQKYAICEVCKKPFTYIKIKDEFVLKEDMDE